MTMKERAVSSRESNIELLRIIAMLMVLLLHFNLALKQPGYSSFECLTSLKIFHIFLQSTCIIAVDLFVIISGWFSIKFSTRGLTKFMFTCTWFALAGIIVSCILSKEIPMVGSIVKSLIWMGGGYWFVRAYLVLFLLSPVLNAYIEKATMSQLRNTVILFYVVQTFFGWFLGTDFMSGYSAISFIGLYLLGRYLYIINIEYPFNEKKVWIVFISTIILNAIYTMVFYAGYNVSIDSPQAYCNPLVVISAASLVIAFSKFRFKSNVINWFATSSFAIYLLHTHGLIFDFYYLDHLRYIYNFYDGIICFGMVIAYLLSVVALAVFIDQPRKLIWAKVSESYVIKKFSYFERK